MRMTRKATVGLVSGTLALVLFAGACAPAAPPAAPAPGPQVGTAPAPQPAATPAAPSPKRGGVLELFSGRDTYVGTMDPGVEADGAPQHVWSPLFNGLLRFGPEDVSRPGPSLARKWEIQDGGLKYVFTLADATWHDGKPFTPEDAKFSIERLMGTQPPVPAHRRIGPPLKTMIDKMAVTGPNTLEITLKKPAGAFISILGSGFVNMVPKHVVTSLPDGRMTSKPIGTGPFKMKEKTRDVSQVLERNPNYFVKGLPYLDGIQNIIIADRGAQIAALQTGRVHLSWRWGAMLPSEARAIKQAQGDNVVVQSLPHNGLQNLNIPHTKKPFTDPRVRKAIWIGLDRKELQQRIWEGGGYPFALLDPRVYGGSALPGSEVPKDGRVAEAKQLLAEAGYPSGVDIGKCEARRLLSYPDLVVVIAAQLRRVGIECQTVVHEAAAGVAKWIKGDFDFAGGIEHGIVVTEPQAVWETLFITNAGANYLKYEDRALMELYNKLVGTVDPAARRDLNLQIQRHLYAQMDHPIIPILWSDWTSVARKEVKGFIPGLSPFDNLQHDTTWLDR